MKKVKISMLNAFVGVVTIIIEILSNILLRRIFFSLLGEKIYGLNEFVKNSIGLLSLAELGIASVIGFSLYKPIATNDKKEITSLMKFYRGIYKKVGITVLVLGVLFSPFLTFFISRHNEIDLGFLHISYFLMLFGTFSTYFFSYTKTFLMANEKNYIINVIKIFYLVSGFIFLALGILNTKSYILYIIVLSCLQISEDFTSYLFTKKKYPYIFAKGKYSLSNDSKQKIKRDIKALISHRIGGVLVLETDCIMITAIYGLSISGFFANYTLISGSVQKVLNQIFDGIRASFGTFSHLKNKEETKKMFFIFQMLGFILYTWASCFILNLSQPFIALWIGKSSQLSILFVILLTVNFYLRGFRSALDLVKDVNGIYHQDRFKPIIEGGVNLIFSILLANFLGPEGIVLGTIISFVGVLLTVEPYVVYKYAFNEKPFSYYKDYIKYFFIFAAVLTSSFVACSFVKLENIINEMIFKFIVCLILPIILFFVFLGKRSEFKFLFRVLQKENMFKKRTL